MVINHRKTTKASLEPVNVDIIAFVCQIYTVLHYRVNDNTNYILRFKSG